MYKFNFKKKFFYCFPYSNDHDKSISSILIVFSFQIYSWARKAGPCGFHLIPVPVDPFALPNCVNSDPLRSPIFVPLALDDVEDSESIFTGKRFDVL